MQSSWFKLFGKNLKIKTAQYIDDKHRYDLDYENKSIKIYTKNIAQLETNVKYVYQDIFFKMIIPLIREINKEMVPKAGLNDIDFKLNQKPPIVAKYFDRQAVVSNVETHEICSKCGANMILRVSKQKGTKFLGCSRFPKCKNIDFLDLKTNQKSKNGWYLYGSPFLLTFSKEVIKSKIIFCLIQTYLSYDTYDFYLELAKLCPDYFVLNGLAANAELKKQIISILRGKDETDNQMIENLISIFFPKDEEPQNV